MELELPAEARALLDAVVAIGSDLDLHGVLRRIVETSCTVTHAEYGVLGIVDDVGTFVDLVVHGTVEEPVFGRFADPRPDSLDAPVLVGEQAFGHLYLGDKAGGEPFTATDRALVEALARAAGVMIDNARAFEESERRRSWMEGAVRITAALGPSLQVDESLVALVEEVREVSGAHSVALIQGAADQPEIAASAGNAEEVALTVKQLSAEIREAAVGGDLVRVELAPGRATLVVPMHTELAPAAVLLVDQAERWTSLRSVERDLVGAFADHIGLTLDRAQALRDRHELLLAKDRDRIARDLHDLVIQRLFATGMQLQGTRSLAIRDEVRRRVGEAVLELDTAIKDLRATIYELGRGGGCTLHEDVRALIDEYAPVLGFLPVLRRSGPVDNALPPDVADALLLALREILSNVARHARAGAATVELVATSRWFSLRVTDDGVGFDPLTVCRGNGLDNVRHRAEALGGHASTETAPGSGCRVEWVVPAIS